MAKYFRPPIVKGKTENQLTKMAVENSNKKDKFLKEFKEVQGVINGSIVVAQNIRMEEAKLKPDTQGITTH